jgi:hypothetical protein
MLRLVAFVALFTVAGAALPQPKLPSAWNPAATEIVRLPQYCWAQFNPAYKSQGIATPMDLCGVGMNHLCPGLVQINRATTATYDKQVRKGALGQARIEISYTMERTSPTCSIAQDVRAADARIKALQQILK